MVPLIAATLIGTGSLINAQAFPASFNRSELDVSDGFVLNGLTEPSAMFDCARCTGLSVAQQHLLHYPGIFTGRLSSANGEA